MESRTFLSLCGLFVGCVAALYAQQLPVLTGYVTRASSASDFDVNCFRILCTGKPGSETKPHPDATVPTADCPAVTPRIGDSFTIHFTVRDTASGAIYATRIVTERSSGIGEISGEAVIDAMPSRYADDASPADLILSADGYRIHITANTTVDWSAPLRSLTDIRAGDWIKFKGKLDATGLLAASSAQIGPNTISERERKSRTKNEYDPSSIPDGAKQNYLKDALSASFDPKKFPPFKDASLQARVEKIGNSLIPAYQLAMPVSDPAKADFRFQLIDTKLFLDPYVLSNGTILVPHQAVDRMQNDSQIAAVLADGIARILERQQYRFEGKIKASYASLLAIPVTPYAGISGGIADEIKKKAMEQRSRVSLSLLHAAGYDVTQVPIAWWLLASDNPLPLAYIEMPKRTVYLFRFFSEVWRDPAATAPADH